MIEGKRLTEIINTQHENVKIFFSFLLQTQKLIFG